MFLFVKIPDGPDQSNPDEVEQDDGGDSWAIRALELVETDEDGHFDEHTICTILRVSTNGSDNKFSGNCFYCKR